FNVTATDPDGDSLSLLAFSLPSGATFTPNNPVTGLALVTGTFRWTPTFGQSGSFVVSFQATDSAGRSSPIRSVTISVTETPTDLLFTPSVAGQDPRGGAPGTIGVVIPIYLTSTLPAYGVQFDFVYDAAVFTVTQLQVSDRLVGFSIYDNVGETPGRLRVLAFSLTGSPIASGTSPTLFNVVGNISGAAVPGAYDIVFEDAWESINPDPNVASVPLTTSDGSVFVDAFGDANLDTRIDVGDVVAVVGYILNDFTFTQRQFVAADVLPNDTVDVFDLVSIINMIFGSPLFGQPSSDRPATVDLVYDPTDGPGGSYVLSADLPMDVYGAQIELSYDPTVTELGGAFADPEAARVDLRYRDRGDGRLITLLTYNPFLSDSRIPRGKSTILRIPVISSSVPAESVRLRSVKLSDGEGRRIEVAGYGGVPRGFMLEQNYPNPFNAGTTVPFTIRDVGAAGAIDVRVEVFNVLGQRVVTLHEGQLAAGHYALQWDGRDGSGRAVASGLYFYRARYYDARTGAFTQQDPIGFAGLEVNLYRYVFNNPTNLTDPSGQFGIAGAFLGFVSGGVGGYIASGGDPVGTAIGAVVGAAVGFVAPAISSAAGAAAVSAIASAAGQGATIVTNPNASFSPSAVLGAGIGGFLGFPVGNLVSKLGNVLGAAAEGAIVGLGELLGPGLFDIRPAFGDPAC
ncbi:MAG: T9SS type A sorting domain-containing protein, partial [Acidobacteria bacterium]|nr:T9SS type A sorting domain-containing protein [Acidobacteriota bacterium]